jgi:DNA-binding transcriptional ArsR family regulator
LDQHIIGTRELHSILKDPTRRQIIDLLSQKKEISYVELLNLLEINNTGKLNYHLKILGDLIRKSESGKYQLTEKGELAVSVMRKFSADLGFSSRSQFRWLGGISLIFSVPIIVISLGLGLSSQESAASFALGVIGATLVVLGIATYTQHRGLSVNGLSNLRQVLTISTSNFLLVVLPALALFLSRPLFLPPATLVYLYVLPGLTSWILLTVRFGIFSLKAQLKSTIPSVAILLSLAFLTTVWGTPLKGGSGSMFGIPIPDWLLSYFTFGSVSIPASAFIALIPACLLGLVLPELAYRVLADIERNTKLKR